MWVQVKLDGHESQFRLALRLTCIFTGKARHGMVKHIRDNRRAWRKEQVR